MSLLGEIYHNVRAQTLENQGDYAGAVRHVLQGSGESWEKKQRAGHLMQQAGRYRDAVRYYLEAINEAPYRNKWDYLPVIECYEALGEFGEALEIDFKHRCRSYSWGDIYKQYKKYREKSPSFQLSRSRLCELYVSMCRGTSPLPDLSESERRAVIEEMAALGLIDEAIQALTEMVKWSIDRFKEEHCKLGELYEKKGDFERAAQLYEDYNLLEQAARCYERSGKPDKAVLYLLGEGRVKDAVSLWERTGHSERIKRLLDLSEFSLLTFEHPLRRVPNLTAEKRASIFERVEDRFNAMVERLSFQRDKALSDLHQWSARAILTANGARLDHQSGDAELMRFAGVALLPVEVESLYRMADDEDMTDQIAVAIKRLRSSTKSLEGWRWYIDPIFVKAYLLAGQFFHGILVAEAARRILESRRDPLGDVPYTIWRCYEMAGAFDEVVERIHRVISEREGNQSESARGWHTFYLDLVRLHLKRGDFAKAGDALRRYCDKGNGSVYDRLLAAELYQWGGDLHGSAKVLEDLIAQSRREGTLHTTARLLEDVGFFEEAAKIYSELGPQ